MIDFVIRTKNDGIFEFVSKVVANDSGNINRRYRFGDENVVARQSVPMHLLFVVEEEWEADNGDTVLNQELEKCLSSTLYSRVVVILWYLDEVNFALHFLKQGADYVVSNAMMVVTEFEERSPLGSLLFDIDDVVRSWDNELASMNDKKHPQENDNYIFASLKFGPKEPLTSRREPSDEEKVLNDVFRPVFEHLGIKLKTGKYFNTRHAADDINTSIWNSVLDSSCLIFQISNLTHYVAYEIGLFDAIQKLTKKKKPFLFVRRKGGDRNLESSLTKFRTPLEYWNHTDLAMQLFYKFGGLPKGRGLNANEDGILGENT